MKLTLDQNRRLLLIETEDFTLKLNGKSNTDYKTVLAPLGIELRFEETTIEPSATSDHPKG